MAFNLSMALALLGAFLGGVIGAWLSDYTKHGGNVAWHFANGLITISSWAWLTKCSTVSLLITSTLWDLAYVIAFTGTLYFLVGNELSRIQLLGILFSIVGLFLINR